MSEQPTSKSLQEGIDILQMLGKHFDSQAPLYANGVANDLPVSIQHNCQLALMARHSTQNGLPIPQNMLSHSEDAFQSQDQQYQQTSRVQSPNYNLEYLDGDSDNLINSLNLNQLFFDKLDASTGENTKNVLRNFGNAQNHYILYHRKARQFISDNLSDCTYFDKWVRSHKLENFENFKAAWTYNENRAFGRIYKKLCWNFYTENAIPYVLSSRIKKSQTRNSHLRYIYRFLEGLIDPEDFTYFRKQ